VESFIAYKQIECKTKNKSGLLTAPWCTCFKHSLQWQSKVVAFGTNRKRVYGTSSIGQ